jgi:energy-converting hydrogenase Eha subunit E
MNHYLLAVDIGELPLGNGKTLKNTYATPAPLINSLLKNSLTIAGVIFLALILIGGLGMIIGAGNSDPKKAESSKKTLTSAAIGFAVVFCAYFIIQIIQVITGLNILGD